MFRIGGSVVALVLLVAGLMYANQQKADETLDLHRIVLEQIETLPDYTSHGSLYNKWFDTHHEAAVDANYTIERRGGRRGRTTSEFDADGYLNDLFNAMVSDAISEGYTEQAEHLRHLQSELSIIEVEE